MSGISLTDGMCSSPTTVMDYVNLFTLVCRGHIPEAVDDPVPNRFDAVVMLVFWDIPVRLAFPIFFPPIDLGMAVERAVAVRCPPRCGDSLYIGDERTSGETR